MPGPAIESRAGRSASSDRNVRRAIGGLSAVLLAWSIGGLIVNPDFAAGGAATAERFVFIDFNGWHALSGIALALPGLVAARQADRARVFAWIAAAGLGASGLWAVVSTRLTPLIYLPNHEADAVLHLAFAALFAGAALLHRRERTTDGAATA